MMSSLVLTMAKRVNYNLFIAI
ncbi:hypothetical protein F8388_004542, partial [Cannabis sativa]